MKRRYLVLAALFMFFIIAVLAVAMLSVVEEAVEEQQESAYSFAGLGMGRAGDSGYAVFSHEGPANVTLVSLRARPDLRITIINDSDGIEMESLPEFISRVEALEAYGFDVEVTDTRMLLSEGGLYIVPTGAIPNYVYDDLWYNATQRQVVFIGYDDLVIRDGVKKEAWYASLSEAQRGRVHVYNMTLDELNGSGIGIVEDMLYNSWNVESSSSRAFGGSGHDTITTYLGGSSYLRLIEGNGSGGTVIDSPPIPGAGKSLAPEPAAIYPWGSSTLSFDLTKTNGTASLSVMKDGEEVLKEELSRVTDENFFIKRLGFEEPGEYAILVSDNDGLIASGLLHVYDLRISLREIQGVNYVFEVTVDGQPMKSAEAKVWMNNSTISKDVFVYDGLLSVGAQPEQGLNTFNVGLLGTVVPVQVNTPGSSLLVFYATYGIPGLLIVAVVFVLARMSRRPVYRVRFSDLGSEIRREVRTSPSGALGAFLKVRQEMRLGKSPLTAEEFAISLKRSVTNGADVTSGNVEELLNKMCQAGLLECHRGYYQPRGEGDVRKNALMRMAREKLIENGVPFTAKKDRFVTKDFEIGFFGGDFRRKALIIVDDEQDARKLMSSLDDRQRSMLNIRMSNGMLEFVPISRLGEYL